MFRLLRSVLLVWLSLLWMEQVWAAEALHAKIDRIVAQSQIGPQAAITSDAQFLRRAFLDLAGRIPSSDQTRTFLDDTSTDKRVRLIDQLIGSPQYAWHMTNVFSVMLMERRKSPGSGHRADWLAFLRSSLEQNKPWNQMAAEILLADGADEKKRGPANFLLARAAEANLMTREVARMFYGMDVQCAQCHDHPLIDDYRQKDYYGIYAFLSRTYLFQPDKKKPGVLAEKAEGGAKFKSVFTGDEGDTLPRLPGEAEILELEMTKGEPQGARK